MKKSVLKVMIGSVIFTVVIACLLILIGEMSVVGSRAMLSAFAVFWYSIPCLFYAKIYDNPNYRNLALIGTVLAYLTALIYILTGWEVLTISWSLTKLLAILNVLVWMLAIISWLLKTKSVNNTLHLFKTIGVFLSVLLGSSIILLIIFEKYPDGFILRLLLVVVLLHIGSLICNGILRSVYKKEIAAHETENNTPVSNPEEVPNNEKNEK